MTEPFLLIPEGTARLTRHLRLSLLVALGFLAAASCTRQAEPIKIGFLGQFDSGTLELSIQSRDGITLLLEEVNRQGGVRGHPLKLVVANAGEAPASSYEALIADGVSLVIGPLTSAKCTAILQTANRLAVPVISPTCSSPELSGQKDAFFRVCPDTLQNAEALARFSREELGVKRIAVINDIDNASFTRPWLKSFTETVNTFSGEVVTEVPFRSSEHPALKQLFEAVHASQPDALLILADPLFVGRLAQLSQHKLGDIPILTSAWALTGKLAQYAGPTTEQIYSVQNRGFVPPSKQRELFEVQFKERFGKAPLLAAEFGYEAALVAVKSLRISLSADTQLRNLTGLGEIEGLDGIIRMDQYGDASRRTAIVSYRDGSWSTFSAAL